MWKAKCPNLNNKDKTAEKEKLSKNSKGKQAYIASDENDSTTSYSSKEEEEINLCLMGKKESMVSSTGSNNSSMFENYNTLLQAFHEIHEEANRLAGVNNRLKGLNNWLEKRVSSLEEELENVKTDFEHLNLIFQSSNYEGESSKPAKCENCEVLEAKVKYLVKTSSKLDMGTKNLNVVLGSQNCVFEKAGIGFKLMFKKKIRKFSSFFKTSNQHTSRFQSCFYYLHKGYTMRSCRARLYEVPNSCMKWIPKDSINSSGPKTNRVPVFIK